MNLSQWQMDSEQFPVRNPREVNTWDVLQWKRQSRPKD